MRRLLLAAVAVAACLLSREATGAAVIDMLGRQVAVPPHPQRIISLAPSITEILYAVGAAGQIAGVTDYCDYPPEAREKPRVGGTMNPNLEAIVAARPDLILATADANRLETASVLERLGYPVYGVLPKDTEGVFEAIRRIGGLVGRPGEALNLVASMQGRVRAVADRVAGRPVRRTLVVVWPDPLIVAGQGSFIADLVRLAGGRNVAPPGTVRYPRMSLEAVLEADPEVIVTSSMMGEVTEAEAMQVWSRWSGVSAVRRGQVYAIPGDFLHRPGPRIMQGLERLARAIHPEVFPGAGRGGGGDGSPAR